MIKIDNNTVDLCLQVEEHSNINDVMSRLTLDIDHILIICPPLFFERFVQDFYNTSDFSTDAIEKIADSIPNDIGWLTFSFFFKGKEFVFHFIITGSKSKHVSHPFKGDQVFKVGIKQIEI